MTIEATRYSATLKGLEAVGDVSDLLDKGLVEKDGDDYTAVVPPRQEGRTRSGGGEFRVEWTDEELLDRVRLWTVIVGKPPASHHWKPSRMGEIIRKQIATLRRRVQAHKEIMDLHAAGDWPNVQALERRFGSLNAAVVIAGFEPRAPGKQPTEINPVSRRKTVEDCVTEVEQAREGNKEGLRAALYGLAAAALAEADRLSAKAETLDGPRFVEWCESNGLKTYTQFGSSLARSFNRWKNGESVGIARADDVVMALGFHLHELPDEVWS